MSEQRQETMWAIWERGIDLYCGTYLTRAEAMEDATRNWRLSWEQCRKRGLRAVKVTITYEVPRA